MSNTPNPSGAPARSKPVNNDSKPATEKNQLSQLIVTALEDLKGNNIACLDVAHLTDIMDVMIVVSGTSNRHVKSLADHAVQELKKAGHRAYGVEGADAGEWVLVDFGEVVLHVMQPHTREFYDLERLWSAAPEQAQD